MLPTALIGLHSSSMCFFIRLYTGLFVRVEYRCRLVRLELTSDILERHTRFVPVVLTIVGPPIRKPSLVLIKVVLYPALVVDRFF